MDTTTALTTALAAGRIGIGLAAVAAPGWMGGIWVGRVAKRPDAQVMVRAFGVRDIALGAATLGALRAAGPGGVGFRVLTGLGVAVDLVDAASTLAARDDLPDARVSAGVAGLAAATGVAILASAADDG